MPWVTDAARLPDCGLCPNSLENHRITRFADDGRWFALCPAAYQTISDVTNQQLLADLAHGHPIPSA